MKIKVLILFLSMLSASVFAQKDFALGADISWVSQMEQQGKKFYDLTGRERDCYSLLKDYGINCIRLRVWVDPKGWGNWCDKNDVLKKALRAKADGMDVMIDFHYSDSWADPAKQFIPEAWKNHDYEQMKQDVANHTIEVLSLLKENGVKPRWIQVGNETSDGFLWPMGKASENPEQYAGLFKAGYDACKKVFRKSIVIVHLDNGFDQHLYEWNLGILRQYGAKFDMIGMSLYPYWSMEAGKEPSAEKTITDCINNINHVARMFKKPVMIVETGYEVNEQKPEIMEEGRDQLARLIRESKLLTGGKCKGVVYWEPECSPRQYKLGAFTSDGRPTAIMDGFKAK